MKLQFNGLTHACMLLYDSVQWWAIIAFSNAEDALQCCIFQVEQFLYNFPSHLQFETFDFQLHLGAEFCIRRSMQNDWKIANVIYIKVRLEETNYASDSRQYS